MSQFVSINKSTHLESTQPHRIVLLCVCVCVYVCVCMYVFFLFVKRSTYICRPLHKYEINTCVSTSFSVHLDARIVEMAGGQVDSVESTWVKLTLRASTRRQALATVIPIQIWCLMSK